jgi:hypothetical protein
MAIQEFEQVLQSYETAIAALYGQGGLDRVERGEIDLISGPELETRAQDVLDGSSNLGAALLPRLHSDDPRKRELAEAQMLAAAAVDLAVANDLALADQPSLPYAGVERSGAISATLTEAFAVLRISPDGGADALLAGTQAVQRRARPTHPEAARQALKDTVSGALIDITDDAGDAGQAALMGLLQLGAPPLQDAANVAVQGLLSEFSEGLSAILRKAVQLVMRALQKLLDLLGPDRATEGRKEAAAWVEVLAAGPLVGALLKRLYELDRLDTDMARTIDEAGTPSGAEPFNTAAQHTDELSTSFKKRKDMVKLVLRGLGWARAWVMTLQPWGPILVTATYLAAGAYVVFAGGGQLATYRFSSSPFGAVYGVRTIIRTMRIGTGGRDPDE